MTINDDKSQPYRECHRCGIVTLDWKLLAIRDPQGVPLEERYICLECSKAVDKIIAKRKKGGKKKTKYS